LLLRLLFLFLIAYLLLSLLKAYLIGHKSGRRSRDSRTAGEDMVLDPQCQTYVPKSEALLREGKYFCSQECARLYLSR
jgi:uncharacterized protein